MDMFKDEINRELSRLKDKIDTQSSLTEEDLKILLLSVLREEDMHESNQ